MSRPTRVPITAGSAAWDADLEDNLIALLSGPLPIAEHSGNESDLQSTFAASSYAECLIWVNHTIRGWTLYYSNGTTWGIWKPARRFIRSVASASGPYTVQDYDDLMVVTGTSAVTINLPAVASNVGRELWFKKTGASGNITLEGNASERIDGALNLVFSTQYQIVKLISDGADWHNVS